MSVGPPSPGTPSSRGTAKRFDVRRTAQPDGIATHVLAEDLGWLRLSSPANDTRVTPRAVPSRPVLGPPHE
jgi:hypothetical protein